MNRYLVKATGVGALGGLLFGFDTAVIAGTTQQLTKVFHLTPDTLGLTVFIGLVGTVIGAMVSGKLGQRIGGREALRIMAVLYLVSAVGCAFAWNWDSLMVFRLIGGLGTPFAFFAGMMLLQFFVVLFVYPETKGSSLEAIQAKLGIH